MFRKILVGIALALCALGTTASQVTVNVDNLSDAQIAELKATAARAVADATKGDTPASSAGSTITLAATWGQQAATAAEGFAKALGIAARELGVTVNDFLHTDAGKITAVLIIWKVAGAAAIKMLYGLLFVTVGLSFVRVMYMRLFTQEYKEVEYSRLFGMFKGTKLVRIPKSFSDLMTDGEWLAVWIMLGITALTLGIGATFF